MRSSLAGLALLGFVSGCLPLGVPQRAQLLPAGGWRAGVSPGVAGQVGPEAIRLALAPAISYQQGVGHGLELGAWLYPVGMQLQLKLALFGDLAPRSESAAAKASGKRASSKFSNAGKLALSLAPSVGFMVEYWPPPDRRQTDPRQWIGQVLSFRLPLLLGLGFRRGDELTLGAQLQLLSWSPRERFAFQKIDLLPGLSVAYELRLSNRLHLTPSLEFALPLFRTPYVLNQIGSPVMLQFSIGLVFG